MNKTNCMQIIEKKINVHITSQCIIIIPWRTHAVSIVLYEKMQSFGATLKFDPHFSRLMV